MPKINLSISPDIQCNSVTLDKIRAYSYHNHQQNLFLIALLCDNLVTILLLIIYNI